jgi:hypothetical protein
MCHVVGATLVSVLNAITSLLVDLVPSQSSSITACVCQRLFGFMQVLIFSILAEQRRPLLDGCRHGNHYKPHYHCDG